MYKLSKYFSKGNGRNKIFKQERVHLELKSIYESAYGYELPALIPKLKKMMPMKMVDVYEVMKALYVLNITKH